MAARKSNIDLAERADHRFAGHPPSEFGGSASEGAYHAVRHWIMVGDLAPGELVSEGDVATALGCSRTPVREAFLRLQTEGWMRLYPKRGALIVPVGADEADELDDARLTLELAAVRAIIACRVRRKELSLSLRKTIDVLASAAACGDRPAYLAADLDFCRAIVRAPGNTLLCDFYDNLVDRQQVQLAAEVKFAARERIPFLPTDDHQLLVDALTAGDAAECETRLRLHSQLARSRGTDDRIGGSSRASTPADRRTGV